MRLRAGRNRWLREIEWDRIPLLQLQNVFHEVRIVLNLCGQRGPVSGRSVVAETGLRLRAQMAAMVGGGEDFDVLVPGA